MEIGPLRKRKWNTELQEKGIESKPQNDEKELGTLRTRGWNSEPHEKGERKLNLKNKEQEL